ncbi:WD repeat-containing protein on Y chromosome [Chanos chanos]|uniref:WD repeat-containing protein on Y chromosome n=1 Tax=Chanos chanos TaxID=29144 RepID=A0A6J2VGF7_CHACN|nr:WD repeat-containing protein on Y chromosome-like [Chanos chanos]
MDKPRRCKDDPWKVYEEEIPSSVTRYDGQSGYSQDTLTLNHLLLLRESFSKQQSPKSKSLKKKGSHKTGYEGRFSDNCMCLAEFCSTLRAVVGPDCWTSEMEEFLNEMDLSCDGHVSWEKICTYMLQQYRQKDEMSQGGHSVSLSEPLIRHCLYNKQEPVTRVVAVSKPPPLRYVSVSKGGTITVWSSHLHMLKSLEVGKLSGGRHGEVGTRGRSGTWITDAVYMPNVHKIAVATMTRDIHFIDVSTNYTEEIHLFGVFHWAPEEQCVLMWGDKSGSVNLLRFLLPYKGLFETPFKVQSGPHRIFMRNIHDHSSLVSHRVIPNVHPESINRIMYESDADLIITSSENPSSSVVITDLHLKRKNYIWKIHKGVRCFDFSLTLSLLVTGGLDRRVRLWNRYVTKHPVAILQGHQSTVLDVAFHQCQGKIFSYSKDAVLKIWDISSEQCVRTLQLDFPCIQPGRSPEHGSFPFLLDFAVTPVLLVTCREYMALLSLDTGDAGNGPDQLSCILYNPLFKQVVTAYVNSSLAVWDVETGVRCLEVKNAHGRAEITCMALDRRQRRLITGASNGTIKVWNFLYGHILYKLEAVSRTEVKGVICYHDNQLLANMYVKADLPWKSARQHREPILAVDHCPHRRLLATGSSDGEIIIWTLDTQRPLCHFHKVQHGKLVGGRAQNQQWKRTALLFTSQRGWLYSWSIQGPTHCHGRFYVPDKANEFVPGLSTDQDNTFLVTGDTTGHIQVWNISQYALGTGHEPVEERPPLLHSWRAHEGALVSLEVLALSSRLFLVSACQDQTARLWTNDGSLFPESYGVAGKKGQLSALLAVVEVTILNTPSVSGSVDMFIFYRLVPWTPEWSLQNTQAAWLQH